MLTTSGMFKNKLILFTLAGVNFTHIMFTMILMPLGDEFMQEFGINAFQFSHLVSIYAFAAFFSGFAGIFLMDLFDRKKTLLFLYSGFWITAIGCGLVGSYMELLVLRCISGMFGGVIGALALAIVSELYSHRERSSALGVLMAGFSAAAALGVPFGLLLADWFSWRMPFLFIGVLGFFLTVFIVFFFPGIRPKVKHQRQSLFDNTLIKISKSANQLKAQLVAFTIVMGHFLPIPFIAPYMIRNVGFDMQQISYIYLVGGALTVFTTPLIGKISDIVGPAKAMIIFMVLSFIPVVWLTNLGEVHLWIGLLVTSLFFVFGSGRMIAPQTIITSAAPPETRGGFMSLKSALSQLSIAAASFFSGAIVQISDQGTFVNYNIVGYISIGFCLMAIVLAFRLRVARGN